NFLLTPVSARGSGAGWRLRARKRPGHGPVAPGACPSAPPETGPGATPPMLRPRPTHAPAPQHRLYFFPLPHGHGSLRPTRWVTRRCTTVVAAAVPGPGRRAADAAAMPAPPPAAAWAAAAAPRTLPPARPSKAASLVLAWRSR